MKDWIRLFLALFGLFQASFAFSAEIHPDLKTDFADATSVWVIFKDKHLETDTAKAAAQAELRQWVTSRASVRRAIRGDASSISRERDLRVEPINMAEILRTGVRYRATSRWFNAISVDATKEQLVRISLMPQVSRLEPVWKAGIRRDVEVIKAGITSVFPAVRGASSINYGNSGPQLQQVNVIAAHNAGYDGMGVVIGLMDVGFYKHHESLVTRTLLNEWDFVFNDGDVERNMSDPNDYSDWHGTATWSVAGGFKDGVLVGAAYNATFLLAKTEDLRSETPVEEDYWVAGLEWMEANGADVVSSSLGYLYFDGGVGNHTYSQLDGKTVKTSVAANIAASLGVVVCNSIGNNGSGAHTLTTPADALYIISCGAVSNDGVLADFSSRGPTYDGRIKPEVCSQGVGDWLATETRPGQSYGTGNGTSFSCPIVAGAAALVIQAHPYWTPQMVRETLMATASSNTAPDNNYGWGIINVMAAINYSFSAVADWNLFH
ncbi:MAG: S8 family serine peptidase [bacterium]